MKLNTLPKSFALLCITFAAVSCTDSSDSTADTVALATTTTTLETTTTDGATTTTDAAITTTTTTSDASDMEGVTPIPPAVVDETLSSIPASSSISAADAAGLVWMREEEKLARDVYITLGNLWGSNVFANISQAEETHVSAVGVLLDRYDIEDPIDSTEVGAFTDPTFTKLYQDLVAAGSKSLVDAFTVGALIEDLDIMDLQRLQSAMPDIAIVYDSLELGSRNHLRAFYRQLQMMGVGYTPSYISQSEFDSIIAGSMEQGRR
jgi:hypothetical protein